MVIDCGCLFTSRLVELTDAGSNDKSSEKLKPWKEGKSHHRKREKDSHNLTIHRTFSEAGLTTDSEAVSSRKSRRFPEAQCIVNEVIHGC